MALFSQYLMRDDAPRSDGYRYRGFESGLRRSDGREKPAYRAFANPLAVERYGSAATCCGACIRPQRERHAGRRSRCAGTGKSWSKLRTLTTTSSGRLRAPRAHRNGQQYRVRWTGQDGRARTGPPIQSY